jgi:hypothetical protein
MGFQLLQQVSGVAGVWILRTVQVASKLVVREPVDDSLDAVSELYWSSRVVGRK